MKRWFSNCFSARSTETLRWELINIISKTEKLNRDSLVGHRRYLYSNLHRLHNLNLNSFVKAENLDALMYSRYHTQRVMIQEMCLFDEYDDRISLEHDHNTMCEFNDIFHKSSRIETAVEMDALYLGAIQNTPREYLEIHERLTRNSATTMTTLAEQDAFYIGTSQTDDYIRDAMELDLMRFITKRERVLYFLNRFNN